MIGLCEEDHLTEKQKEKKEKNKVTKILRIIKEICSQRKVKLGPFQTKLLLYFTMIPGSA